MLLGVFELPLYALRRGRQAEAARAVLSMGAHAAAVLLLWRRCWVATLYTLVLPYLVSSLALMFGNWCVPCSCRWENSGIDSAAPVLGHCRNSCVRGMMRLEVPHPRRACNGQALHMPAPWLWPGGNTRSQPAPQRDSPCGRCCHVRSG